MNILVLAGAYPHPGHPFAGTFNEKCALALKEHCDVLEVLSPRPFVPGFLRFHPRWSAYGRVRPYEVRCELPIFRPATLVIPKLASAFWLDQGAYLFLRRTARERHERIGFQAIMSFDLIETGGIAWRLSKYLGIPASGWAFGEDLRYPRSSPAAAVVRRAIENLSCVFYQSEELLERGRELLGDSFSPNIARRQHVLPHGIPTPPPLPHAEIRRKVRRELGMTDQEILVLNISRVIRTKGVFELLDAFESAVAANPLLRCVWVGAKQGFDDYQAVEARIRSTPGMAGKVRLLPACSPEQVWEYLSGADIYAFPSHREGMSNSLLEAMVMGLPVVAFAIPPNCEVDSGAGVLLLVPPFDVKIFSECLTRLSLSPEMRAIHGKLGRTVIRDRFLVEKNMKRALEELVRVSLDDTVFASVP
jgi:glycosyltransferase involved in cell wall biosynthesis